MPTARAPLQIQRLSSAGRGEPPRKRGRPSKAEIQRRAEMAQSRGEPYPPPKRPIAKKNYGAAPPMMTGAESMPSAAGLMQQSASAHQHHRHEGGTFMNSREETTTQAEEIQMRRLTAPHIMGGPVYGDSASGASGKESMPRTLEGQITPSPTTFSQSFRSIMQSNPGVPNPRHDSGLVSNMVEAEGGVDSAHSMLEGQRET